VFKYHVIEPKQRRLEYRINSFLIKRGFGIHDWELRFKEIDVTDETKVAGIVNKLVRLGVMTINDARRALNQKPLEHRGADVPFINTASGPLSLDVLAEGGVRPTSMPRKSGEETGGSPAGPVDAALADLRESLCGTDVAGQLERTLTDLRKAVRGEYRRRIAG
jgi:hypothetical protein